MEFLTVTNLIIAITCLVSYRAFTDAQLKLNLIFHPVRVKARKTYYEFFTAGLLHADPTHLMFNMITLYFFGNNVEYIFSVLFPGYGIFLYIALYVLGLLFSSLPVYAKEQDNPSYFALGASGAVSAVLFANILFDPWGILYIMMAIPCPQIIAGIAYLWYSSYMNKHGNDNIGHSAHFFGAVFGFLFTGALQPELFVNFFECTIQFNQECLRDYVRQLRAR